MAVLYPCASANAYSTYSRRLAARATFNYHCIGGVIDDLDKDFVDDVKETSRNHAQGNQEYDTIFTGNVICPQPYEGRRRALQEDVVSYGATGPVGRASGWSMRRAQDCPYGIYSGFSSMKSRLHPRRRLHGPLSHCVSRGKSSRAAARDSSRCGTAPCSRHA